MTRALIMAGGADEKWTKLGGEGRRHFQVVCGETVLDRIVRQLRDRGVTDIGIICPRELAPLYDRPGVFLVPPKYSEWGHEGLNGQHHWHEQARTLMVYGDTVFTNTAMDRIVGFDRQQFMMFGRYDKGFRPEPYRIKGGGGELFAFSFWPEQREVWAAAVRESFDLFGQGVIKRGGSWEGMRIMAGASGLAVGRHRFYPKVFMNLRDQTDDFDTPAQFEKLRALFEALAMPLPA